MRSFQLTILNLTDLCKFAQISDVLWYHNNKLLKTSDTVVVDVDLNRCETTVIIKSATYEQEGYYQCKLTNEISTNVTRAKFSLSSTAAGHQEPVEALRPPPKFKKNKKIIRKNIEHPVEHKAIVEDLPTKVIVEIPKETEATVIQSSSKTSTTTQSSSAQKTIQVIRHTKVTEEENVEIHEEIEEIRAKIYKELITEKDIRSFKIATEVNKVLELIEAQKFGTGEMPLRELATIGYLVQRGITVTEITHLYNADSFPALKNPEAQAALVHLVERQGHGALISEVLTEETTIDDEHLFASTVGFRAFMRMIQLEHVTIEEVITHFRTEDFERHEWKHAESRTAEVTEYRQSVTTGEYAFLLTQCLFRINYRLVQ